MKTQELKVIFLDIDGVLQPLGKQDRFNHIKEIDVVYKKLTEEFGIDYYQYDKYDIAAVYYDWDKESIAELKSVLNITEAKIVISSDWKRYRGLQRVVDFLRVYGLSDYVIDATPDYDKDPEVKQYGKENKIFNDRALEILVYLKRHPEITRYAALDDIDLTSHLGDNAVVTRYKMTKKDADRCIDLLR